MRAAVLYARVSTQTQADQGTSLDTQLEACRNLADRLGYIVIEEIAEDITGTTLHRPGLDRVRDLAERGLVQAVICFHPDRFARDLVDMLLVKRELDRANVQLLFVNVPNDTSPFGIAMLQMAGIFAELERKQILERTRRGKERRLREGKPIGTWMVPYGYRYIKGEGRYEIHEAEAAVVRTIYTWLIEEHMSCSGIAARLNAQGIPTKRRGRITDQAQWSPSTVYRILRTELYTGTAYWNKYENVVPRWRRDLSKKGSSQKTGRRLRPRSEWVPLSVPPIIDRVTYETAQQQLRANSVHARRNKRYDYLLSGRLICTRCGRRYYGHNNLARALARGSTPYVVYSCPNRLLSRCRFESRRCNNTIYKVDWLDSQVWNALVAYITAPTRIYPPLPDADATASTDELEAAERQLRRIAEEEDRMLEAYREKIIDLPRLKHEMDRLQKRRELAAHAHSVALDRIQARQKAATLRETMEERRQLARAGIDNLDFEGKRRLLEELDITVFIDGGKVTITGLLTNDIVVYCEQAAAEG